MRSARFVTVSSAALLLVLGACGGTSSGGGAGDPSGSASVTGTPSASTSASATVTATATGSVTTTKSTPKPPVIRLRGDGLEVVRGSITTVLKFGTTSKSVTIAAVTSSLGTLALNDLPDCGQGPRTSAVRQGFSLLFDGDHFVGWTDQGYAKRALKTRQGVGIGSTVGEVKAQIPGVSFADSSIGHEWTAPAGLSGIVSATSGGGKLTVFSGGETCFFR